MRRRTVVFSVVVVALLAVLLGVGLISRGGAHKPEPTAVANARTSRPPPEMPDPSNPNPGGRKPLEGEELISYLRSQFGMKLANPYVQVRMLEKLLRQFRKSHPDTWHAEILAVLRAAFPDRYAELVGTLQHWIDYERWHDENKGKLMELPEAERRKALWDKRNELFGKGAAEQIWQSELKNQTFADALKAIDTPGSSINDKLSMYRESIDDIYQENAEQFLANHRQEVMNRFLDLPTVQQELSAMTPEQRSQSLRQIRQGMGLDAEALARWDTLDQTRDARWDAGARYMKEREALAQKHQGEELERQLQPLREKYFGAEAETVAGEEASGFFRFTRPRVWGRN